MNPKRAVWISAIVIIPFYLLLLAGMFWIAGTTHLPFFWAVFGSQALISLTAVLVLDPELVSERFKPKGKDLDAFSLPLIIILLLTHMTVAALDVGRFHWSDTVPVAIQWVALIVQALGWIGFTWAMQVNRYFSSAVRIQEDRGQTVISSGPYHWIRHPGYGFVIVAFLAQGIALGSWFSVIPLALLIPLFFRRTLMEEKMLFENLQGYEEYAKATPYRWVPFIW